MSVDRRTFVQVTGAAAAALSLPRRAFGIGRPDADPIRIGVIGCGGRGTGAVTDALTASGLIDLVVGHHTHVIQPIEQVNGVWTVFGMGNSLSNMPVGPYPPESQDGVVVEVSFDVAPDGTVTVARPVVYPCLLYTSPSPRDS